MEADLEAIARCLAGEQQAFAGLVERHKSVVFSLACHLVNNATEAEDIAQEAFVKAYLSLASFRQECSFRNWLCQITNHLCIDRLRARRAEQKWRVEGEFPEPAHRGHAEALVTQEEVRMALGRLPAHLRAAVVLRHLQELSYEEMAEILRLPLGTVKTHLRRGRAALKKELERLRREEVPVGRKAEEV